MHSRQDLLVAIDRSFHRLGVLGDPRRICSNQSTTFAADTASHIPSGWIDALLKLSMPIRLHARQIVIIDGKTPAE